MSFIPDDPKMQSAVLQLRLAFDANDTTSMQDALRKIEAAKQASQRRRKRTSLFR